MDQKQLTGQNISDGAESKEHIGAGGDGSGSGRESRDAGWVIANIRDFAAISYRLLDVSYAGGISVVLWG